MLSRFKSRAARLSRASRELLIILLIMAVLGAISAHADLFEKFWQISRAHHDWQLDGAFTVLIFLSFGLGLFSWRRWRELGVELKRHALLERQLIESRNRAQSVSRTKSEFLANMSHEIRTPMNGIIGMTDLALNTSLSEEQRDYLQTARASAESLLVIINDILDFSRVEAGKLSIDSVVFDLPETLRECLRMVASQAHRKGLDLLLDLAPDLPDQVIGDPVRVRQIVCNLLGNAVKFTERGEVLLRVRPHRENGMDGIHFEVRDSGIGIPAGKVATIFDAFTQADAGITRQYGGTGLGLTIVAKLLRLMQGDIRVESEPGVGSTFHVRIPFERAPSAAPSSTPALDEFAGARMLVVDENSAHRGILSGMLSAWGFQVITARGPFEAIELLRAAHRAAEPFRLVLSDPCMADMGGSTLTKEMVRDPELRSVPVVMVCSMHCHRKTDELANLGFSACLTKPVVRPELGRLLERLLKDSPGGPVAPPNLVTFPACDRTLRVLLAEDNEVNQKVGTTVLRKLGHTVVLVANGKQAVEAVSKERFDLVLMDVQMPEMDGLEATRVIRGHEGQAAARHIPIVGVTAGAMKSDVDACFAAGMNGYIAKPFRVQQLLAVMEQVLRPEQAPVNLPL